MSKQNAFLTPDIVIKTKLDSIWTDLQSNLPSIEFDSNNEVNFFLNFNSIHLIKIYNRTMMRI